MCVCVHACAHHRYPGSDAFEHHVFEATPGGIWKEQMGWSSAAAQADKRIRFHNVAVWNRDTTLRFGVRKSASHVVEGTGGASGVFGNDTKVKATHEIIALDFAKWLLESVKPDDFVLVKMDIVRAVLPSASRAQHMERTCTHVPLVVAPHLVHTSPMPSPCVVACYMLAC